MCGGQGTRLASDTEKPLYEIGAKPMVCRVIDALEDSCAETIYGAVSPATPETRATLSSRPVTILDTPGAGYVEDLRCALDSCGTPALTVAADLPLLDGEAIDRVISAHDGGSRNVYTPAAVKARLGIEYETAIERDGQTLVPCGINIVGSGEENVQVTRDNRFAVNVNRQRDGQIAEALL